MGVSKKGSDPSRAERKAKKRKLEDTIPDLPGDGEAQEAITNTTDDDKLSKRRRIANNDSNAGENRIIDENGKKSAMKEKKQREAEEVTGESVDDEDAKKVSKKAKRSKTEGKAESLIKESPQGLEQTAGKEDVSRKSKKERKAERKVREAAKKGAGQDGDVPAEDLRPKLQPPSTVATVLIAPEEKKPKKNNRNREKKRKAVLETGEQGKAPRFIAFIGMFHL
jgi:nucleolar protein 6